MTTIELAAAMYRAGVNWHTIRNFINSANKYPDAWKRYVDSLGAFADAGQRDMISERDVEKFLSAMTGLNSYSPEIQAISDCFGAAFDLLHRDQNHAKKA